MFLGLVLSLMGEGFGPRAGCSVEKERYLPSAGTTT